MGDYSVSLLLMALAVETSAIIFLVFLTILFIKKYLEKKKELARAESLSITDHLTGLFNRRHLDQRLAEEVDRVNRYASDLTIMAIDLDDFKAVNDTYGHKNGDQLLIKTAEILSSGRRSTDIVTRPGGDEFLILLPGITWKDGLRAAQKISLAVKKIKISANGHRASISIGIHQPVPGQKQSPLEAADAAMYAAKSNGKGKIAVSDLNIR